MPVPIQVALFFAGLFALAVLIPKLALRLGAPYHWFPAHQYPLCPTCRARGTMVCCSNGPGGLMDPRSILDHYRCAACGARWMARFDGPWQDASAPEHDDYYSLGLEVGEGTALSPDE